MSELVNRLSQGDHEVTYRPRSGDARAELREAIDRNYVHVFFKGTRGGTELGFAIDADRSDLSAADWDQHRGTVRLVGELKLDGVPVHCVAEIDLGSMEGTGRLVVLEHPQGVA
jgi:hypothetical protein